MRRTEERSMPLSPQKFEKLLSSKACTLYDSQGQPTAQVAIVLGYDDTGVITGTQKNNVATCLMIDLKVRTLKDLDYLA
jgi:hypothetical protein